MQKKQRWEYLYFGNTIVHFETVPGQSITFTSDTFIESDDTESVENARSRTKPLSHLGTYCRIIPN
jgi:hypothetical protein